VNDVQPSEDECPMSKPHDAVMNAMEKELWCGARSAGGTKPTRITSTENQKNKTYERHQ